MYAIRSYYASRPSEASIPGSTSSSVVSMGRMRRAKKMPISNSSNIGMASSVCEKTSGGVSSIATIKTPIRMYGRCLASASGSSTPMRVSKMMAMGTSKAMPKTKNRRSTKFRITSYNVCYTKLLRRRGILVDHQRESRFPLWSGR